MRTHGTLASGKKNETDSTKTAATQSQQVLARALLQPVGGRYFHRVLPWWVGVSCGAATLIRRGRGYVAGRAVNWNNDDDLKKTKKIMTIKKQKEKKKRENV